MKENNKVVKDSPNAEGSSAGRRPSGGVGALNAMKYDILNRQQDFADSNETIQIPPELIAGYIIQRSPTDKFKFNIYATDSDGDLLFCAASDLPFEKASAMVDVVNQEHYPVVPSPTEAVFVEIGGESKVYNITSK